MRRWPGVRHGARHDRHATATSPARYLGRAGWTPARRCPRRRSCCPAAPEELHRARRRDHRCRPRRRPAQVLRQGRHRGDRAGRRDAGVRARSLHRRHGPLRLRQVHADALPGRAGQRRQRRGRRRRRVADRHERQAAHRPAPRPGGLRLPAVQPAADADRRGERPAAAGHRRPHPRPGLVRRGHPRRGARRPALPPAGRAVRRSAAARGVRPRPRHPARRRLRRRADGQPGLPQRRRGPGLPAAQRPGVRPDRRHGHARPGGRVVRRPGRLPRRRPARRRDARSHRRVGPGPDEGVRARRSAA